MKSNLIEHKANELLDMFGAGSHKPGSGSAAALQGLLAAQLIKTVATLTCERQQYADLHPEFSKILAEIDNDIYPRLEILFQEDSVQFSKVIEARAARNHVKGTSRWPQLAKLALYELKPATEIPLEIGGLCLRLAEFGNSIFDRGFQAARGDSGVALNGALSAVAGSLSIIDLNLLSFGSDEWTSEIRDAVTRLRTEYELLSSGALRRLEELKVQTDHIFHFHRNLDAFRSDVRTRRLRSDTDIERVARQLQGAMLKNYKIIWKKDPPANLIDMLKPELAIELLGYQYELHTTLGQHDIGGTLFEVAGQIDSDEKSVSLSSQFPIEIRNFTAAHELGHALLHQHSSLHRDRPLDGSLSTGVRDTTERQADKFATYFLMPKNLLSERFRTTFKLDQFTVNADTAFALNYASPNELRKKAGSKRGLAQILAAAELYDGTQIYSIAKQFGVSVGAMAIRLDELDLVAW